MRAAALVLVVMLGCEDRDFVPTAPAPAAAPVAIELPESVSYVPDIRALCETMCDLREKRDRLQKDVDELRRRAKEQGLDVEAVEAQAQAKIEYVEPRSRPRPVRRVR
jgi:hypothetical protein